MCRCWRTRQRKYSRTFSGVGARRGNSRFITGMSSMTISASSSRLNRFDTVPDDSTLFRYSRNASSFTSCWIVASVLFPFFLVIVCFVFLGEPLVYPSGSFGKWNQKRRSLPERGFSLQKETIFFASRGRQPAPFTTWFANDSTVKIHFKAFTVNKDP